MMRRARRLTALLGLTILASLFGAGSAAGADDSRTIAEVYRPGEVSAWLFTRQGSPIGHCRSQYEGRASVGQTSAHFFRAQVQLRVDTPGGALDARLTAHLWTDDHGHPLRFELRSLTSDVYARVELAFRGDKADATIVQGPTSRTLEVPADPAAYLLANNFVSHIETLLRVAPPSPDEPRSYSLFSGNVLRKIPFEVKPTGSAGDAADEPAVRVYADSLGETIHLADDGRLVRLDLPAQGITMQRTDDPPVIFEIAPPDEKADSVADLDREEVTVTHGEVTLAGTITRPKGSKGRLPALFFISGSGLQERNGNAAGIDAGTGAILDRLTEAGFLVLRVDDRGAGASRGPLDDMGFDDLIDDARACVRFLAKRTDVDPARIAVLGHSEGGITAPILALDDDPALAAIALLAAPGRNILDLAREQLRNAKAREGVSGDALDAYDRELADFFARAAGDGPLAPGSVPEAARMLVPARAWIRTHAKVDPAANIARVRCPVLILQGARDFQVTVERDAKPLWAALEAADHPDHRLVTFETLDHLFKKTHEGSIGLDYMKKRPVSEELFDVLVPWLTERLLAPDEDR